jgi:hypothetical protein
LEVHDQLVAKEFVLVDDEGDIAASITPAPAGFIGLHVGSPERGAQPSVLVGIEANTGLPIVSVRYSGGAVAIAVTEDGQAAIHVHDAEGHERIIGTE